MQGCLYAPVISRGRKTDDCKTKSSTEFSYFEVAFHASYVVNLVVPYPSFVILGISLYLLEFGSSVIFEPPGLLPLLNLLFLFICPMVVGYLAAKGYLERGSSTLIRMQANKAFYEMMGYSHDEFWDRKWQDITHPDDVELSQRVVDSILSGEKNSERFVKRYLHKNGSIVWADVGTALRRDREGKPLYLMATISNITEQRTAEGTLRESEKKFRKYFELGTIGMPSI